jgi:hypothetical protein
MTKQKKGPKVLDPTNLCIGCEVKDGTAPHPCPLASALKGAGVNQTSCNCCGVCQQKCYLES